jgi:DNA-binding transcriptional LysR family regulator
MAIFAKTIDHGSFRGAARELRLSPSVVSHHISQLEDSLGVALIYPLWLIHSPTVPLAIG